MNTGAKIGLTVALAAITCGVAAYPISCTVGQDYYDEIITSVTSKTHLIDGNECTIAVTETGRTFSSRSADAVITCGDETLNSKIETTFGVLSAKMAVDADYNNSSLVKKYVGKAGSIETKPEPQVFVINYLSKTVDTDYQIDKITVWSSQRSSEKKVLTNITGHIQYDLQNISKDPVEIIKSGDNAGSMNSNIEHVALNFHNYAVNVEDVSVDSIFYAINQAAKGNVKFKTANLLDNEKELVSINNFVSSYDTLIGRDNDYGFSLGVNFDYLRVANDLTKSFIPQKNNDTTIDNFNLAFVQGGLTESDLRNILDLKYDDYVNTESKLSYSIKDLSFKIDNALLSLSLDAVGNMKDIPSINVNGKLSVHQDVIKNILTPYAFFVDGFVKQGFVQLDGDTYKTSVNVNNGQILINGKQFK